MDVKKMMNKNVFIFSSEQKKRFYEYLPKKVYKTERNISILVAFTQICMMLLFIVNKRLSFANIRAMQYFALYTFLFTSTCVALLAYRYTTRNCSNTCFVWVRRTYALVLCLWVIGMTYLEQSSGKGVTVYCYLMPTMAALLLLTPIESFVLLLGTWVALAVLFIVEGNSASMFGDMVNSVFVTMLSLFISIRYYHSMAVEFCDRETISSQYEEIEKTNTLLFEMANADQLTGFYNRRYLIDHIYKRFEIARKENEYGMFLMMDIDYFKQYNDSFGHIQGDVCIQQLADIVNKHCRKTDVEAIRYGGEEFLLVSLTQEPLDGRTFANALLQDIYDLNLARNDIAFDRVTVSIGIWYGELSAIDHIERGIKIADEALYKAKNSGRNCIVQGNDMETGSVIK